MNSLAKRQAPPWIEQSLRQAASLASVPGLPTEAVLCVRHLTARLDTHAPHHTGSLIGMGERLSYQLQTIAGKARRPAREIVPEDAAAILFDDPAQMLACAARDRLDGRFSSHWWWRSLIDGGALAQGAIALWLRHVVHIPAALVALNTRAEEFCRRITVSEADVLVARLIETGAPDLRHPHSGALADRPPLLTELAPEDPRQQLFAIGLSLTQTTVRAHRALAATRSALHGAQTAASDAGDPKAQRRTPPRPNEAPESASALGLEAEARSATQTRSTTVIPEQEAPIRPTAMPSRRQVEKASQFADLNVSAAPMPNADARTNERSPPEPRTETESETRSPDARPIGSARAFTGTSVAILVQPLPQIPDAGQWFETRFGGVLYLLNVAIHLGLYPDFTQPRSPGLALSPWAFLALSGERLAGRRLRRDALWTLLTALAGTEAEQSVVSPETSPPPSVPEAMRPYLGTRKQEAAIPADSWPAWIEQLIPPLRRRLAAALGAPPRQAGRFLCCQTARIRFGTGRLDAHFSLNDHPIAIRIAGLDRDPGWLPSAGCDIRFFYD